ncbi:MAG: hypothetical protein HYT79_02170 [Elusimicrobia bacterium]|nr:hypothetical protein [Elusimicrobiota bacterium]
MAAVLIASSTAVFAGSPALNSEEEKQAAQPQVIMEGSEKPDYTLGVSGSDCDGTFDKCVVAPVSPLVYPNKSDLEAREQCSLVCDGAPKFTKAARNLILAPYALATTVYNTVKWQASKVDNPLAKVGVGLFGLAEGLIVGAFVLVVALFFSVFGLLAGAFTGNW